MITLWIQHAETKVSIDETCSQKGSTHQDRSILGQIMTHNWWLTRSILDELIQYKRSISWMDDVNVRSKWSFSVSLK